MKTSSIGIDLGSRTTKIVVLRDGSLAKYEIFDTGCAPLSHVKTFLRDYPGSPIMTTGYGRHMLAEELSAKKVTEIKACAKGAFFLFPQCRTVLDVGGQDCKVLSLDDSGRVLNFEMNDRCAAGTGKFLEVMADTFKMNLNSFVNTAMETSSHISINSMCTVFAESEVISLITRGKPLNEIARGVHISVAKRLTVMLSKYLTKEQMLFVGGGALNECLNNLLQDEIGREIICPENPQIVTALGASLLA